MRLLPEDKGDQFVVPDRSGDPQGVGHQRGGVRKAALPHQELDLVVDGVPLARGVADPAEDVGGALVHLPRLVPSAGPERLDGEIVQAVRLLEQVVELGVDLQGELAVRIAAPRDPSVA